MKEGMTGTGAIRVLMPSRDVLHILEAAVNALPQWNKFLEGTTDKTITPRDLIKVERIHCQGKWMWHKQEQAEFDIGRSNHWFMQAFELDSDIRSQLREVANASRYQFKSQPPSVWGENLALFIVTIKRISEDVIYNQVKGPGTSDMDDGYPISARNLIYVN
jgi:hypothetical protein